MGGQIRATKETMNVKRLGIVVAGGLAVAIVRAAEKPAEPGRALAEKKCRMCHELDGKGGKAGQPLKGIADGKSDEQLRAVLLNPKRALGPKTKMPSFARKLSGDEEQAIIEFVKSLKK